MNLQVTINSGLYLIFGSMMLFMSPFLTMSLPLNGAQTKRKYQTTR